MDAKGFNVKELLAMAHSPVKNYAIPGLTSSLIGNPGPAGTMRLFQCERDHQETITPHSHRFDFQCWVLRGEVRNRIWTESYKGDPNADLFLQSRLACSGMGRYGTSPIGIASWLYTDTVYEAGDCYAMKAHQIHSIFFSRGAIVLFFEGAKKVHESLILEPVVDGEVVPTFKVEPWMFKREKS